MFFECMTCVKSYDHQGVANREYTATKVLAEALSSLQRVLWTSAWGPVVEDDSMQKGITIMRCGAQIRMARDARLGAV